MSKNKTVRSVFFLVFCLLTCAGFSRAESGSSKGQVQYKANGGCGTSERTAALGNVSPAIINRAIIPGN